MARTRADIVIHSTLLPSGYTRLEYVTCDGEQWFNAGFRGKDTLDFDVTAMATDSSELTYYGIFGGSSSSSGGRYDAHIGPDSLPLTRVTIGRATKYLRVNRDTAFGKVRIVKTGDEYTVYNDGVIAGASTLTSVSYTAGRNVVIGALNNNATEVRYPFVGRLYRLTFGSVADFVPAVRESDGVAGFYDLIRGAFYRSTTGTEFGAGPKLTVPITPEARRTFSLMKEDSVRLRWDSPDEYRARVGDWINDELFGRFHVTEEQEPTYDVATGAFRHDVRFDRDYIGWGNVLHLMTHESGGVDVRRETDWSLTDTLANHLSQIARGLRAVGYSVAEPVIGSGVENPDTAVCVSFQGTSVLGALDALAGAFNCEWWVTYSGGSAVIHMGKMELPDTPTVITLGENAEDVTPSRSGSVTANRVFAFGSTRNIPDTYRKTLKFSVTDTDTRTSDGENATVYRDSSRVVTKDMLRLTEALDQTLRLASPVYEDNTDGKRYKAVFSGTLLIGGKVRYSLSGSFDYAAEFARDDEAEPLEVKGWKWELRVDSTVIKSGDGDFGGHERAIGRAVKSVRFAIDDDTLILLQPGEHEVALSVWTEDTQMLMSSVSANSCTLSMEAVGYGVDCPLTYGGNEYTVTFNPLAETITRAVFNWFAFKTAAPSGFGVGSGFTPGVSDNERTSGLLPLKIPVSFYSDDLGSLTSVKMVGERRLMLPLPNPGYVESGDTSAGRLVEKVVVFDEIYPRLYLQITEISEGTYSDNTEWSDGSRSYGSIPKYTFRAKRITSGGLADFEFRNDYLTSEPLQAVFVTASESGSARDSKLAGMTFNLSFSEAAQTYTIAFNEDYGVKLPNGVLRPEVGDGLVLTGWNTGAITSLGLVSDAESELLSAANAYLQAVQAPAFTWRCRMMSDSMLSDGLLEPGERVTIRRGSLSDTTRVIGFEYKLDIPEDTPEYDCGETETYSRLRDLERKLNARTLDATSSGGSVSSSYSEGNTPGGGVADRLKGALSWVGGPMGSFAGDTFDGSEDKTLTLPVEVGHLQGSEALPRIAETVETLTDGRIVTLRDALGAKVFPVSSLDWFIAETYEDGGETKRRLRLNPKYQGMYADGWISAAGVSSQGGALVTSLGDLSDVDLSVSPVAGQALVFNGTAWTAGKVSGGGGPEKVFFGTCATSDGAKGKVVTCPDFTSSDLVEGTVVHVVMTNENTGGAPTLNVNGTGAKLILYPYTKVWDAGELVTFVYYNTGWKMSTTGASMTPTGGSSVSWGTVSGNTVPLTVDGTTKTVLLSGWAPDLSAYAPLASPALTGTPTAPTAAKGTNTTQIATTAFVQTALGDYLPLTAGSGKPLTGALHINPSTGEDPAISITAASNTAYHGINFVSAGVVQGRVAANTGGLIQIYARGNAVIRTGGTTTSGFTISAPTTSASTGATSYQMYPAIAGAITLNGSTGKFSALGDGADLASPGTPLRSLSAKVIYLASGVYLYYDTVNNCIRTNAPIVSDSYISAGGVSNT